MSQAPGESPMGPNALWAPWRLEYVETADAANRPTDSPPTPPATPKAEASAPGGTGSFLRDYWLKPQDDAKNHVIFRDGQGMILLNGFPYSGGHLLVALGEPRPRLIDYDAGQRAALWALTDRAADLMERALNPQGVNIGINQGRAAGAGVPQHLHVHLVPRWSGDVNFLSAVGQVRVIPASLEAMAARYRAALKG